MNQPAVKPPRERPISLHSCRRGVCTSRAVPKCSPRKRRREHSRRPRD